MMDLRIQNIRQAEKESHEQTYNQNELFQNGSWLAKPVKTVLDIFPHLERKRNLRILDLGCGVGRNCIPAAQMLDCSVDCVDILPLAINKLMNSAERYGVADRIHGIISSIDDFSIQHDCYDLILAISALEHVESEIRFCQKLEEIQSGIKPDGIVCLIVNSQVTEVDVGSESTLEPQFEVNLPTEKMKSLLLSVFFGWEILKHTVVHQCYEIPRSTGIAKINTDVVTLVARKFE